MRQWQLAEYPVPSPEEIQPDRVYAFSLRDTVPYVPAPVGELAREINLRYGVNGASGVHWYDLNVYNTYIRTFDTGNGQYDHVYHATADGGSVAFPLHYPYFEDLTRAVTQWDFPQHHSRIPDDTTLRWYTHLCSLGFDQLTKNN